MNEATGLSKIARNSDVAMALGVVGILMVMILPIPPSFLDALLSFSITFGLIILLVSLYTLEPLEFSVFPSLLLVTTLFRLSLNVASTRLILLNGHEGSGGAGQVIEAFGNFVVGGNYVVGVVVFIILVIINFVVITKGAGRIAEVAARFTLDAIPGKQMAIDADLNAGLVNEAEARKRRRDNQPGGRLFSAPWTVRVNSSGAMQSRASSSPSSTYWAVSPSGYSSAVCPSPRRRALTPSSRWETGWSLRFPRCSFPPRRLSSLPAQRSSLILARQSPGRFSVIRARLAWRAVLLFVLGMFPGLPQIPFILLAGLTGGTAYYLSQAKKGGNRAQGGRGSGRSGG